ncbi:signal peptidase II [Rhodococcoides fascians]|uniref:Lipoprotein signal peptidase n=2 Tax=Rhodococcus TaxID=1827 RepID=A0ABU9D4D2_9NOCA|nr:MULTISPECIES: signal peptidase II [Rhodococcus]MDZ7914733.1 signal peptidase II [Rhodococcus sp. (in: high G+C Gram-positive bacteria)]KAA0921718.1 signal peptidase II [Rhodococcus sp. ANT_H53B]MDI9927061.1 signal peptidase II [Rhodococcus sp. IEGM 1341]MDV6305645.1 signal peptidase II [Rhodococcus cerastii]MDV7989066.1 signal peptidase II [Rhodococcus sp. IEGM 1374]
MTRSPIATARLRAAATALVLALVAAALLVDYWAQAALPGSTIPLRILELRLAFNRGMAFSLGDSLPVWVVVAVTASITTGLAIYGWRTAPHAGPVTTAALSLVLAGALSNVLDRLLDGAVTDYFHTGWWPTFNLADIYITCGVVLMIGAALFTREATKITPRPAVPDSAES